jgi:hypothetical protein
MSRTPVGEPKTKSSRPARPLRAGAARTPGPEEAAGQLREAAAWRLQGLLLERPRPGWLEEIEELAREAADPRLHEAASAARGATEGLYLAAFGPGGYASPREVAYRTMEDPARLLSELSGWYEAFAYRPRTEDPPDHIAVEAGFVGYLLLKEAMARLAGDDEAAGTTALSRERFSGERLRPFATELAGRLQGASGHLEPAAVSLLERAWS